MTGFFSSFLSCACGRLACAITSAGNAIKAPSARAVVKILIRRMPFPLLRGRHPQPITPDGSGMIPPSAIVDRRSHLGVAQIDGRTPKCHSAWGQSGGMRRLIARLVVLAGVALPLAGCGFADMRAPLPEFMRAKAPDPALPEPPPDMKRLMHENMETVFTSASQPSRVRVSTPRREPTGLNWTACVRADLNSVMGKPLGTQTYRLTVSN